MNDIDGSKNGWSIRPDIYFHHRNRANIYINIYINAPQPSDDAAQDTQGAVTMQ